MKMAIRYPALLMVAALALGGCALSPQQITIQPALDVAALPGDGGARTVALAVTDTRSNLVLGGRGGVYETATVTVSGDMPERIHRELSQVLVARGFNVAPEGSPANITLVVEVTGLSYVTRQGQLTRTVEVSASIRARSVAGDSTRTGEYRDTRTKEFVKPPTDGENSVLVNEVVSAALQRLVADAELLKP